MEKMWSETQKKEKNGGNNLWTGQVRSKDWHLCPDYDGVPEYGGPCWTCQGDEDRCPMTNKESSEDG